MGEDTGLVLSSICHLLPRLSTLEIDMPPQPPAANRNIQEDEQVPPPPSARPRADYDSPCCITGRLALLEPLATRMVTLSILGQHLTAPDAASLGKLSGLRSLSLSWSLAPSWQSGGRASSAWLHLASLTALTSLRVAFFVPPPGGDVRLEEEEEDAVRMIPSSTEAGIHLLSVASLLQLRRLSLTGCVDVGLALSVGRLRASLEELDFRGMGVHITPTVVIQVGLSLLEVWQILSR